MAGSAVLVIDASSVTSDTAISTAPSARPLPVNGGAGEVALGDAGIRRTIATSRRFNRACERSAWRAVRAHVGAL